MKNWLRSSLWKEYSIEICWVNINIWARISLYSIWSDCPTIWDVTDIKPGKIFLNGSQFLVDDINKIVECPNVEQKHYISGIISFTFNRYQGAMGNSTQK